MFRRPTTFELFLIQAIVYILIWFWNDYVASILTLSFAAIALFILAVSLISEALDKSKVPRWYFGYMAVSVLTPLLVGAFFLYLNKGSFAWMRGF